MKNLKLPQLMITLTMITSVAAVEEPIDEARTAMAAASQNGATAPIGLRPATRSPSAAAKNLRLNFRGVPLEMVLNYLSEAAGLIVVQETEVKGKVEVWSQQPMNTDEAVNLLNSVLHRNGYAALRNERTLTIVNREEARKRSIPVKRGNDPTAVPKTEEMVTQIIPVRYADAPQLIKDLQPLLPTYATLTANESGNALVLTAIQTDIRRMMEIVKALDTTGARNSTLRVLALRFADATELANLVKELFPAPGNTGRGNSGSSNPTATLFAGGPGGGGPFGGGPSGGGSTASSTASAGQPTAPQVTVVADEHTNSLIVSAPDEALLVIEQLVAQIDTNAEKITELRVFTLKNADPAELADTLSQLFPDDSNTENDRTTLQFGGGPFGALPVANTTSSTSSSKRAAQKSRLVTVPDARTASLLVAAGSDLMPHVEKVVAQLDANPAHKQKVFVYTLQNSSTTAMSQILQDLFQAQSAQSSSSLQNTDALLTRQSQTAQSTSQSSLSFGNNSSSGQSRSSGSNLP